MTKMMTENELSPQEIALLRERCGYVILRLPSPQEFDEWSKKLKRATTDDELVLVAQNLLYLIEAYKRVRGIDILHRW